MNPKEPRLLKLTPPFCKMATARSTILCLLFIVLLLVTTAIATSCTSLPEIQEECMRSLLPGQYPLIDVEGGKEERIFVRYFS